MLDITKKEFKQIVVEAIEPFAKATQKDFQRIDKRFDGIDKRFEGMEIRLTNVEIVVGELRQEMGELKNRLDDLVHKLDKIISLFLKQEQEMLAFGIQLKRLEDRIALLEAERRHGQKIV